MLALTAAFFVSSAFAQKRPVASTMAADAGATPPPTGELTAGPDDSALLRAILSAHAPAPQEIRVLAVEDLGLLGDPRALDVLGEFLRDGNPAVQAAALRAIRAYQHPRAEQLLVDLVRDPRAQEPLRVSAAEALAFQRSASAIAFLRSVRADPRYGPKLQNTARVVLDRVAAG
jgi:HEAT repeat protein